jgi:hypothetical protein
MTDNGKVIEPMYSARSKMAAGETAFRFEQENEYTRGASMDKENVSLVLVIIDA